MGEASKRQRAETRSQLYARVWLIVRRVLIAFTSCRPHARHSVVTFSQNHHPNSEVDTVIIPVFHKEEAESQRV